MSKQAKITKTENTQVTPVTIGLHSIVRELSGGDRVWNGSRAGKPFRDVLRACRGMDADFAARHPHGAAWTFTDKRDIVLADIIARAVTMDNGGIRNAMRQAREHFGVTVAPKQSKAVATK
jgi:hypothetical protein